MMILKSNNHAYSIIMWVISWAKIYRFIIIRKIFINYISLRANYLDIFYFIILQILSDFDVSKYVQIYVSQDSSGQS